MLEPGDYRWLCVCLERAERLAEEAFFDLQRREGAKVALDCRRSVLAPKNDETPAG